MCRYRTKSISGRGKCIVVVVGVVVVVVVGRSS